MRERKYTTLTWWLVSALTHGKKSCMNLRSFSAANTHHSLHLFFVMQGISSPPKFKFMKSNYVETYFPPLDWWIQLKKKKRKEKKKVVSATTEHPVEKTCLERGLCIRLLYKLSVWTNTKFTLFKDRHITVINHTQSQIQTSPHYYASCKQLCSKTNCFHIKDQDLFGSRHVVVLCFPFCPLGPLESTQMKGPRCCFKHNGNRLSKYIRAGKKHVTYAFDERKIEMWRL